MLVSVNYQLDERWASGHTGRIVLIVLIEMGDLPTVGGGIIPEAGNPGLCKRGEMS